MKISPRYGTDPIIRLDGAPPAIAEPLLRQRRRFARALSSFSADQWEMPSRCEGWRVQDVAAHLTTVDQFWNLSIVSGLGGAPTRFLQDFDPKAVPAAMVDTARGASRADALAAYLEASEALSATFEALDDAGWSTLAESPAGHVSISALAHHALWDSWVHERDVLVPLGIEQELEPDEIAASVRYAAALSPALAITSGCGQTGTLGLDLEDPEIRAVVIVDGDVDVVAGAAPAGAFVLRGDAVSVLEALSVRAPLSQPVPDDEAWLLTGLVEAFESTAPTRN